MAGCKKNKANKGRCVRCTQSAEITACYDPNNSHIGWLYCYKYENFCKRVAWNCNR